MAADPLVITFDVDASVLDGWAAVFPALWRRYGSSLDLSRLSPKARELALGLLHGAEDLSQAITADLDLSAGGAGDPLLTVEPSEPALELLLALRARDADLHRF